MQIVEKRITDLVGYENNPRNNKKAVGAVAESIKRYGFKVPLVVDKNNVIVCGHTRIAAAKRLKMKTVPCIVADDLTPEQIKEFRLVDNKVAEFAVWDLDKLQVELDGITEDLSCFDFDLSLPSMEESNEPEESQHDYGEERRILNLEIANFDGVGEYGIPELLPEEFEPCEFIPFSDANTFKGDENATGIHFFIDDYRFNRVWNNPTEQVKVLSRFKCVLTPDFSLFINTPKAVQIFNHYRKHWCGAFWQLYGLKVIPTICWSDKASFEWCFDGEPKGGAVAVSSVGVMASKETKELFMAGYNEMKKRLEPAQIIHYGKPIEEIKGEVVEIEAFQAKFDRKRE